MHTYAAQLHEGHLRPFPLVAEFSANRLTWWPQLGIGHYPVTAGIEPYDQEYFDRFGRDAATPLGRLLMQGRLEFVHRHHKGKLIDVGIGSGAFVELRRAHRRLTCGYDVNPAGVKWLKERGLLFDPYKSTPAAMTLWDVLEHIPDYRPLLANVREWLFVSLPIFTDAEHVLRSKHFRPQEHIWYFTREGLLNAMKACGFSLVAESDFETALGREDIGTFAFRRET
jgi:hypothetical protein